ncbi:MAG: terminase TerL endonuclease subunit [Thiohalobacteraceae bacterium]
MLTVDSIVDGTLARIGLRAPDLSGPIPALPDICEWAEGERGFYIAETRRPIVLEPHQRTVLRLMTQQHPVSGRFRFTTGMWSTIKKSGKTTISALYSRWAAETWGAFQEIYNLGNKLPQAQGRAFKKVKQSILLAPPAVREQWDITATRMTHLPSGSEIVALPINDEGEAGSNPSLTVWTELWGYQYEVALRMWDELQPVATRPLSQRFIDTYAGYEGESELLWSLWRLALDEGERLDDDLPIYAVESAGLIAYIDTGVAARRMPWQQGEEGRRYYAQQEKSERPHNFARLHLNEWTASINALIPMPVWDGLVYDRRRIRDDVPVWLAADAAVSGDSMALMAVTVSGDTVIELATWIWEPPQGGKLDYDETLIPAVKAAIERWHVMGVAYDEYQLHSDMTRMAKRYPHIPFFAFPQGAPRMVADTHFVKRVQEGRFRHTGNPKLRAHVQNADGKEMMGGEALRIVKRSETKKIDGAVTGSMASEYATELWEHVDTVYDESVRVNIGDY